MFHVAYEILHNEQNAEDATHQAFVRIAENIRKIDVPVCPKTRSYVVTIAQAVMERPDILMLDEPTNALDQDSVKLIRGLIKSEKDRGAIVLLASHNKEDIQLLCDHTFTMDSGAIVGR